MNYWGRFKQLMLLTLVYAFVSTCLPFSLYATEQQQQPLFIMRGKEKVFIADTLILTDPLTIYYEVPKDTGRTECKIDDEIVGISYSKPARFNLNPKTFLTTYHTIRFITYDCNNNLLLKTSYTLKVKINQPIPERALRKKADYGTQKAQYHTGYIPILMYHDIVPSQALKNNSAQVNTALFKEQLQGLLDAGYTPINFYDYANYINQKQGLPEKPIIITFDDGYLSNYTYAYPILKELDIQATYFIATAYIGKKTSGNDHFTWENAAEMEQSGLIDIQSHTHTHSNMRLLDDAALTYELFTSFELIEQNLGLRDIRVLSYPQFRNSLNTRRAASKFNIQLQITNLATPNALGSYPTDLKRIHVHNNLSAQALVEEIKTLTECPVAQNN